MQMAALSTTNIRVKCRKTFPLKEITFSFTRFIIMGFENIYRERVKPKHTHTGKCHSNKAKIIITGAWNSTQAWKTEPVPHGLCS